MSRIPVFRIDDSPEAKGHRFLERLEQVRERKFMALVKAQGAPLSRLEQRIGTHAWVFLAGGLVGAWVMLAVVFAILGWFGSHS